MAIDPQIVGNTGLTLMEQIDATTAADASVEAIGFLVAINNGDGTTTAHQVFRDGDGENLARYRGLGLLEEVSRSI
jgi:hypothetical protein